MFRKEKIEANSARRTDEVTAIMGYTPSSKTQHSAKAKQKTAESAIEDDTPRTPKPNIKKQPATYIPRHASYDNSKTYKPKASVDGPRKAKIRTYQPTTGSKATANSGGRKTNRSEVVKFTPEDVTIPLLRHTGNISISSQIPKPSSPPRPTENRRPQFTLQQIDGSPDDIKPTSSPSPTSTSKTTPPSELAPLSQPTLPPAKEIKLVGISGCSSSGKSTLTYLLSEIFDSASPCESETGKKFLTQDDFFLPKKHIPVTKFTDADSEFVRESARVSKKGGLYSFKEIGGGGGGGKKWEISGPNTDAPTAIDFLEFRHAVTSLKQHGQISAASEKARSRRGLGIVQETGDCTTGSSTRPRMQTHQGHSEDHLIITYAPLITELRNRVQTAMENTSIKFTFVEGFLLFTNPTQPPTPSLLSWNRHLLHDVLTIPIFLPTSKHAAKTRRFARKPYIDPPQGDRVPGQMWMSEGYFKDVVWKGYTDEFGWLLEKLDGKGRVKGFQEGERGTARVHGVWVRNGDDVGVEETVRWAVEVLLGEVREPMDSFVRKALIRS
jgi:hypothetical protein